MNSVKPEKPNKMMKSNIKATETTAQSKAVANHILAKKSVNISRQEIPAIQFKLSIGKSGDKYEQEADRVASQVMRMPDAQIQQQPMEEEEEMMQPKTIGGEISPLVQKQTIEEEEEEEEELLQAKTLPGEVRRQPIEEEEEEEEMLQAKTLPGEVRRQPIEEEEEEEEMLQAKTLPGEVRRQPIEEEEEELMMKRNPGPELPLVQQQEEEEEEIQTKENPAGYHASQDTTSIESQLSNTKGGGSWLPESIRSFMEDRFGADFSGVNVHDDTNAHEMSSQMNAQAFTYGNDIYFGAGRYSPGSAAGRKLLAHELTHVVQQNSGTVSRRSLARGRKSLSLMRKHDVKVSGLTANKIIQRADGSEYYGEQWLAYVYPGKVEKLKDPEEQAERVATGKRVSSFQRFKDRKVITEGGKKIIIIGSAAFDKKEKTKKFAKGTGQKTEVKGKPTEWNIILYIYKLFDPKPSAHDLSQGPLGDCYLLAVLQSMARTNPGQTRLMNMIKPAGDNYSVNFYRLKVFGGKAYPDTNSHIRVGVTKRKSENASEFKFKDGVPLGAAEIAEIKTKSKVIKQGDKVTGKFQTAVTWPWTVEKAYAIVIGSYAKISGGFAEMPMMVILGKTADNYGDFDKDSESDIENFFVTMKDKLSQSKNITVASMTEKELKKTGFSNVIYIKEASAAEVKFYTDTDSSLITWDWAKFEEYVDKYTIFDLPKYIKGEKGGMKEKKSSDKDKKEELKKATSEFWTVIPGTLKQGATYSKGRFLIPGHMFSVQSASKKHIDVLNPWGSYHLNRIKAAEFKRMFTSVEMNK